MLYICRLMIYSFANDYAEGCHPSILKALSDSNLQQQPGYGEDFYSTAAANLIRKRTECSDAAVYFLAGGTLTNLVVLASALKPFESVIAADTGHIHTHETGAIEATGHKIETVSTPDGKLTASNIEPLLNKFPLYHTVKPRLVYISNSTEAGTIYSKQELAELYAFCKENELILYLDGARLISALTARSNDMELADIAAYTDVFYIGGTKCGALFGEALVITNDLLKQDFQYHLKQRGAMMAKGRAIGVQFLTLFQDDLIFRLAAHSNAMACKISDAVRSLGYSFLTDSDSNQIFPILSNAVIDKLKQDYTFFVWKVMDNNTSAIRLITSWATPESSVDEFIATLKRLS